MTVTIPRHTRGAGLRITSALALLSALAACDGSPLDYDLRGRVGGFTTAPAAQTATASRPTADARGLISYPSYQVAVAERGDTLADVATRIGLPVGELAQFNGMQPGDTLRRGEVIALPRRAPDVVPQSEVVAPGGVDIAALAGQAIETAPLASNNPGSATPTTLRPTPKPQATPAVQGGPEPVRHKVERGETAFTISRLYQVPVKSLAEWNGLNSSFSIREGQFLLIPIKDQPAPSRQDQAPAAPEVQVVAAPGVGSPTPTPPSSTKPLPDEKVEPAAAKPEIIPEVTVPAPTQAPDSAMVYPVQGKIIRTYSKGKNDGIDISGPAGATVRAADSGTVAAITKDSNGIPIIVVRHDPKVLTVYANVDKIEVNKGDTVRRGQAIAALREEATPYVHFEVRNGFDSVDPLPYLN
ncbi:peptidoglycan DD-metalloendopeptidase family protein [Epibacterium ulvae]|uniref:peptidoglycan DD-metalloendopeptidase family protein n=1 Tax=Epibacterium ulvae TaxID=1156985 RepID=UPI001BFC83A9|nr:peptidoglycan DD-metalloendopeptidase family protein [Epibacterium ulvae]MBT8152370.1 peptidoglycan DD-metalloendopeptidase family protein [Epibacterium ulvae]